MGFEDMTPKEKVEYKKRVIEDFRSNGMTDREALVNYVCMVNADPYKWLDYRYHMGQEECDMLRKDGSKKYLENGGRISLDPAKPSSAPKRYCKCRQRPIVPE